MADHVKFLAWEQLFHDRLNREGSEVSLGFDHGRREGTRHLSEVETERHENVVASA